MLVTTDKSSYTVGETVLITVTVTANGSPVAGASVHVDINTPGGLVISGDGTTDANGQVAFSLATTRRMGTGTYSVTGTATSGIDAATDTHSFTVN